MAFSGEGRYFADSYTVSVNGAELLAGPVNLEIDGSLELCKFKKQRPDLNLLSGTSTCNFEDECDIDYLKSIFNIGLAGYVYGVDNTEGKQTIMWKYREKIHAIIGDEEYEIDYYVYKDRNVQLYFK